uniref:Kinesin motor domain-containing protein n=1 Tax=Ciona savignyi TaxID=51511 RepID=H2ZK92_CIOSA
MLKDQTLLSQPGKSTTTMLYANITSQTFAFDHCFWSMDSEQKEKFSNQELVFDSLGVELLDNAFAGYNACIFAYGQTGSGKSYTMMGSHEQPGLIPRLCDALFDRIHEETRDNQSFKVEVSYMEIYNEKVRDLLDPNGGKQQHLKVREHKLLGPYVDGLQQLVSSSAQDVQELMSEGSKSRTVAATKMNAESSRSHAVFTLIVTHTMVDVQSGVSGERVSKLSLVDLAGSERSSKTGASGARLKEGSNINKSLTTLGLVISSLADQSAGKAKNKFVPYRDSTLTWILKDNLGGNSRTTMVATLSPSADNYEETLSTLRYADRAKRIVNKAVVNEDPNARIIRELREEVEKLQGQLKQSESMRAPDLKEKLEESEKLIKEISLTWEERLRKTEQVHKQRQETLEKMGISLETSGIKVEKTKCFLVNLNADPSLNELLVYYLKPHTIVGQSDSSDIQLSGLGISQQHAELFVQEEDGVSTVAIEPLDGARTCVNGRVMSSRCNLRHGDRILWGNNHFFRINVPLQFPIFNPIFPHTSGPSLNESRVSYEFAQQEVLLNQSDAPIQETIMSLEREFQLLQDESNGSPSVERLDERERKKYELEIDTLRRQLLMVSPSASADSLDRNQSQNTGDSPASHQRYRNWKLERSTEFRRSICQLREELVRAQTLTREANDLAEEMKRDTEFTVTMRIPTHNLTPNRKQGTLLCEPAVQVIRQGKDCQVWSVEKLSNRIVDMREMYQAHQVDGNAQNKYDDPFNETDRSQLLVGVANVFLTCLLQGNSLRYPVPIINQHGQVAGKLLVDVQRVGGEIPERLLFGGEFPKLNDSVNSKLSSLSSPVEGKRKISPQITCRVTIMEANGLSTSLSPFVECQYSFLDCPEVTLVPPDLSPDKVSPKRRLVCIRFNHTMEFTCNVTEELVDKLTSSASLAVEVWGHRDRYHSNLARTPSSPRAWGSVGRVRGARNRGWSEVLKRLRVDVSIQELADTGEYVAVDILPKPEVPCVGTFQLKQGQSRRIHACVTPVEESGTLPLICDSVAAIYAGSITCRAANRDRGLDSYQDRDLSDLKNEWLKALERRKQHLDKQIKNLTSKENKTELERERESNLFDQWVTLTEERNAMLAPTHSSGVPGAPASWVPPPSVEMHIPIIFLDLDSDPVECEDLIRAPAGLDSELPQEIPGTFVQLPFVRAPQTDHRGQVSATASWDSSMHDSLFLNRV